MRGLLLAVAMTLVVAGDAPATGPPAAVVGFIPAESLAVTRALSDGVRLALGQAAEKDGLEIELVVGSAGTHWSTASTPAVELAFGESVVALLTPPDRATAHLVAQIGSRAHIPVLTTTRAASIGGTGSYWVIPLLELAVGSDATSIEPPEEALKAVDGGFTRAFRAHFDYSPDGWAATGYLAGQAVAQAFRDHALDRLRIVQDLKTLQPVAAPLRPQPTDP